MSLVPKQRATKRCSQCRKQGCNKGRANCLWNRNVDIDRMMRGLPPLFDANRRYVIVVQEEAEEIPQAGLKLGSDYVKELSIVMDCTQEEDGLEKEEEEECGICYTNQCTITTNCGHKYCRVCVQHQCVEIKNKTKGLDCAFCRACVSQLNIADVSTYGIFTAFIQNVF